MAPLVVSLVIAAAAYMFGTYCAVVLFNGLRGRAEARGGGMSVSLPVAILLAILVIGIEVAIYYMLVVYRMVDTAWYLPAALGYHYAWPFIYGLFVAFVVACLVGPASARQGGKALFVLSLPVLICAWALAQWQVDHALL